MVVRDGQLCDCVCARERGESVPLQHAYVIGSRWVLRRCGEVTELGWVGSQVHLLGCLFHSVCVRSRELRASESYGSGTGWGTACVGWTRSVRGVAEDAFAGCNVACRVCGWSASRTCASGGRRCR